MSASLIKKINYQFNDPNLLKVALTHRSKGGEHNERLEFLGDAVVNFIVAEILYHHFPKATEGELSRYRASLVNRDALAEMAKEFELGKYLFLGPGELRSGGSNRQSILSCAMESLIGAIYLDGGFQTIQEKITQWYQKSIQSLASVSEHKDPKTLLQEYLQGKRVALPIYNVDVVSGEAHQQLFTVSCEVHGVSEKTYGKGTSRRKAEQEAAQHMLRKLRS